MIVNSSFLKLPSRIEALGLILVPSLLVWRLLERTMRLSLKERGGTVRGWDKRQTTRPTTLMMTDVFLSVMVVCSAEGRFLAKPLTQMQEDCVRILQVTPAVFTTPAGMSATKPGCIVHHEVPG